MIPWGKYWFCYSVNSCLKNWITVLKLSNFTMKLVHIYLCMVSLFLENTNLGYYELLRDMR